MLEAHKRYGRWKQTGGGRCMCTGDHSRYGLATNFSVCVIELYTTFFTSHVNLWNCRRVNPDKCRYIRQGITIIEPHCNTFADSLRTIIKVKALFSCLFKDGQLDVWAPSFICSEPGISASNRYFQHVSDTIPDDIVPLDENIDPSHILAAAAEDQFVHTINNCVEYYEHVKDDKGSQRYEPQIHL